MAPPKPNAKPAPGSGAGSDAAGPAELLPPDPLYPFRRDAGPRYERANEHARTLPPAPVKGALRYSWLLRGVKPDDGQGDS